MSKVNSFKDLLIWQRGIELVKESYLITTQLPKEEMFGLISQIRRCSVSVPSNIAEGRCRSTKKDFSQFLRIVLGSLAELETQIFLIQDLYKLDIKKISNIITEEQKMIFGILSKLTPNNLTPKS